ncbi:MAG: DUF2065 domain-containing protein [Methylotenera sp.]|uniref:DUF2065 domain-containing protein n=1 Tax=Methylotenera sp. TaxID=2051956 RepID=UPI00180013FB|nr:DUF2065 domain-containing protein [Methylotenera sp.]NOU24512.1 DUF2065 domain-containing protein [Methylotenera sp.]
MNSTLITALGLMLVLEGLLPLLLPRTWRESFKRMIALKDGQLRFIGLVSVFAGVVLILLSS